MVRFRRLRFDWFQNHEHRTERIKKKINAELTSRTVLLKR